MNEIVSLRVREWTNPPFNKETIDEIKKLVSDLLEEELIDRFGTELEFGTGGLRGVIGAGTNRMNIYTVGMATQGLANYLKSYGGEGRGVVVGRDSRIMSYEFARETASILAENGIKVYMFEDIAPVPFVSFAIRELNAKAGVMITASHNPPEYNGYKVYWEDGSQIVPPHDKNIIDEVKKIDSINKIYKIDFDEGIKNGLINPVKNEITEAYVKNLDQASLREKENSNIKIVYTPIHGAGYKIIPSILSRFGFKELAIVDEQLKPDGNFPTVKSPNPEEKDAMAMALGLAKRCDADLILATDPDSDRMGVGFKDMNNEYVLINGNQIGTMLEYYILLRKKEDGTLPDNGAVIKTIVTTELQSEVAQSFNVDIENVLTGFKWIAEKMKFFESKGETTFLFGGEESYGYLPVTFVRDKDAVSSCYFFAEMADWVNKRGLTLQEFLDEIYIKYNLYTEKLISLTLKGTEGLVRIKKIMKKFRNEPPLEINGLQVVGISDMLALVDKNIKNGTKKTITGLPSSNVLQFFLADDSKITMRPSGTEPKIKFYFSIKSNVNKINLNENKRKDTLRIENLAKIFLEKVDDAEG